MITESQIRLALRDCFDPELRVNLADLGAIEQVSLSPDPNAPGSGIAGVDPRFQVRVTLLRRGEDLDPVLCALTHNRLSGIESLSRIEVLTSLERWTEACLTPNGRRLLRLPDPLFPILS